MFTRLLLDEIYYLIELPFEWLIDGATFVCLSDELILGFCYSDFTLETDGFELASTITLVLQANQLTNFHYFSYHRNQSVMDSFYVFHYTDQFLKIFQRINQSLLRKNVTNANFSILRKTTLKLKFSTIGKVWNKWKILDNLSSHLKPMLYLYTPWKYQKIQSFLIFSVGIRVKKCKIMLKMYWVRKLFRAKFASMAVT